MSVYVFAAIILAVLAGVMIAEYHIHRSRQEEHASAKWSDIWEERLRNGR